MAEKKNKNVVCVLGMGRSGTSMIMRILNICGVYIGDEKDMEPASSSNELGHWEHREVLSIDEEILRIFGGSWECPPEFPSGWETDNRLNGLQMRAEAFVKKMSSESKIWGLKQPRMSLTLPFWKRIIPGMIFIIPIRNPVEVAHSLKKRNGLTIKKGLFLWNQHWSKIMEHTEGERRIFTVFDYYFRADWEREVSRLILFIDSQEVSIKGKHKELAEFISPAQVHSRDRNSAWREKILNTFDELMIRKLVFSLMNENLKSIYAEFDKHISEKEKEISILSKKLTAKEKKATSLGLILRRLKEEILR